MKKIVLSLIMTLAFCTFVLAQNKVTGKVTSAEDGEALPGVTILEKGTTNGAVSDVDGNYTISVGGDAVLVFSFLGFTTEEIPVGARSVIDLALITDITTLSEVVVTAFGIEKSQKSLGYSSTVVDGKELTEARDISVASQLSGKVAGVDVTKPVTGPGGSTNIIIRGIGNLSGENRPLIVVDGVPIDNTNIGAAGMWGGKDTGDGFSSLNQDDIENVNVIKGPAAASLYGERGANGVIIITTKKGFATDGIGVEYNGNYVFENALVLPKFQRLYGQGQLGRRPTNQEEAINQSASWGEKFDGVPTPFYDGVSRPYSAVPEDDLRNFYETGSTLSQTLSFYGGTEKTTARLSLSNVDNTSILPNTDYTRYGVNLVVSTELSDKLTIEAKANFVREEATNRPELSDNPNNPGKSFSSIPANISVDLLRNTLRDADGNPLQWTSNIFQLNPYWASVESGNEDRRDRFIGYAKAGYEITDWLTLQLRYGIDTYRHRFSTLEQDGTAFLVDGALTLDTWEVTEENADFLLLFNKQITEEIGLSANFGGVQTTRTREQFGASGRDFIVVGLAAVTNLANRDPARYSLFETETNAFFGSAQIDYKGFLFVDGAIRQDWYSTLTNPNDLDGSDNSAIYGSGAVSFAFSDVISLPSFFTFGKLRATYGSAGNGAPDPYGTALTYALDGLPYNGRHGNTSTGFIGSSVFPNANLKPTRTNSFEIGTDLRFFNNKLGVDFTYYVQNTVDQIFNAATPIPTGFTNAVLNAGDVKNTGIEVLVTGTPVVKGDFRWDISANFTKNENTVEKLAEGVDNLSGEGARFSANLLSEVGGQVGSIYGTVISRNENGQIIHDENGLPVIAAEREILGNFAPDWYGGITNTFTYKNLSFGFLIDVKQGGEIYSLTNSFALSSGKHFRTLVGRENPLFEILGEGVGPDGNSPNTNFARLDAYYGRLSGAASENIFDASYIKLRQVSLGYTFPQSLIGKTPIQSIRLSFVARNLFFFKNGLEDIGLDPESLYSISNSGFEYGTTPGTRTFGFNLNVKL